MVRHLLNLIGIKNFEWRFKFLPYKPRQVSKDQWEQEHASGEWRARLRALPELGRYSAIVGYYHQFAIGGSVLDVGCSDGLLQEKLMPFRYRRYVGFDLSEKAIQAAPSDGRTSFICADATKFETDEEFDFIVFNEVLIYFDDPVGVLARYKKFMTDERAVILVSLYTNERSTRVWQLLDDHPDFKTIDSVYVENTSRNINPVGNSWTVRVFGLK